MTKDTISAEQDKFEEEYPVGMNSFHRKLWFGSFLLASNQRVRLQTLQECLGMIEGEKIKQKVDNGHDCYDKGCDYCENSTYNLALSAIAAKLSALIEQEK